MRRAKTLGRRLVLGALVGALGLLTWGTDAWASVRLAPDIELQTWYRMRHSFQTDGSEHFDWVQWRNEGFIWLTYDNFYNRGKFFGKFEIPVPLVESASFSGRWRSRVDPVYVIRDHYKNLYDEEHTSNWLVPENGFRDLYVDVDHGNIGPGKLYTRWGYQQIVWGESDLFRSIDIVNPLRIDQNFGVGEKFDEFRSPSLAVKALYDIGNIGTVISGAGLEAFYTPKFRYGTRDLVLEDGWRNQFQMRGCERDGVYYDWSMHDCGQVGSDGTIRMLPYRPAWLGSRRSDHPWSLQITGNNARTDSADFLCETGARCAADVPGDRTSIIVNLPKGNSHHHSRGHWHAAGARFIGSTWFNLDFSLNWLYVPFTFANANTVDDFSQYGPDMDGDGMIDGTTQEAAGTFREGLLRCLSPSGKQGVGANGRTNGNFFGGLHGTDLLGYDWGERHVDENGLPTDEAKQAHAIRRNYTYCTNGFSHQRRYSHVIGFTLTYNDFDYTGAVFRFEQSYSTKEGLNKRTLTSHQDRPIDANSRARRRGRILNSAGVWRSMAGFDLIQSLMSYPGMGWTRNLPGQFGVQTSFLTGQWLMMYNNTGRGGMSNNMCNWNFAQGLPASVAEPDAALRTQGDGKYDPANPDDPLAPKRDAVRGCGSKRWNHLFTLAFAGNGYFRGKLEGRNAVAWEP
ncbi:MAG: hypothetical protein J4F42_12145, partial [Desulfurellaceae bacterium]|nr:hypothetical protein [Desulfurellaceae bacterium]